MTLRIVFAGTPEFAVPSLRALVQAGHALRGVYTQPDRPAGRGGKLRASPVKQFAIARGLPVFQPESLRGEAARLADLAAEVMVVVAYGLILPKAVLALPRLGCINVHASLLPRWRGAAPIARALEAGDGVTGITLMQMDAGLDTGAILSQVETPIVDTDTAATLHDRLAELGANALIAALPRLAAGTLPARAQDDAAACYAPKLSKAEAELDWRQPAAVLARKVRAFNPYPVARTYCAHGVLRIWSAAAEPAAAGAAPGEVIAADAGGIRVACGEGVLRIRRLQLAGGRPLDAAAFLNGHPLRAGECWGMS